MEPSGEPNSSGEMFHHWIGGKISGILPGLRRSVGQNVESQGRRTWWANVAPFSAGFWDILTFEMHMPSYAHFQGNIHDGVIFRFEIWTIKRDLDNSMSEQIQPKRIARWICETYTPGTKHMWQIFEPQKYARVANFVWAGIPRYLSNGSG